MRLLLPSLFLCSSLVYGQETQGTVKAETKEKCIPISEICKPVKIKPVKPKPAKPKPAKPKPAKPKPAPKPQKEKDCIITCNCPAQDKEIIYVKKESTYQPHSLSLLAGKGPNAFYPVLEKRSNVEEYKVYRDRGYFVGVQYEYQFAPNWAVGVGYMSNDTWFGSASYKWGQAE